MLVIGVFAGREPEWDMSQGAEAHEVLCPDACTRADLERTLRQPMDHAA